MPTTTVYSSTEDGKIDITDSTWSVAYGAETGDSVSNTEESISNAMAVEYDSELGTYKINRSFFYFSLTSLPASATITGVTFSLFEKTGAGPAKTYVSAFQGTQADSLTVDDFDAFTGSEFGYVAFDDVATYKDIELDSAGIAYIQTLVGSGVAKICCRERTYDVLNTAPDNAYYNSCFYSEQGEGYQPKLTIEYSIVFDTDVLKYTETPIVVIELDLDSGTERYAKNDVEVGSNFYEGRVLSFGTTHRSISNIDGHFEINDVTTIFSNADTHFSTLDLESLLNRTVTYKIGFAGYGYSALKTVFKGVISNFKFSNYTFEIIVTDSTKFLLEKDYGHICDGDDWPDAAVDIKNKKMPIIYGTYAVESSELTIEIRVNTDGTIYQDDAVWATVHDATVADYLWTNDEALTAACHATYAGGSLYQIGRAFFKLSDFLYKMSPTFTVTAASLSLYYNLNTTDPVIILQQGTFDSVSLDDFAAFTGPVLATKDTAGWTSGWLDVDFNSAGLDLLNDEIIGKQELKLFMREKDHDYDDSAPTGNSSLGFYFSEATEDKRPKINITYTAQYGMVKCHCIDSVNNIWLVAGHAVYAIDEVFVVRNGDIPGIGLKTAGFTKYTDYSYAGGLDGKIAVIQFTSGVPDISDSVTCNVRGMENGIGGIIENPINIMKHFLTDYMGLTSSEYDTTSFETAETTADERVYVGAGVIEDAPNAREVIEEMAASWDVVPYFSRDDGKLKVRFIN